MTVLYPGSFDPFTLGHLAIVKHARAIFDDVVIGVGLNEGKNVSFSVEERMKMIRESVEALGADVARGVRVVAFSGLVTHFMKQEGIRTLVRGLRDTNDFLYESKMAKTNNSLYPEMETAFLYTTDQYAHISSTLVKEIAAFSGDLTHLLPAAVIPYVTARFRNERGERS